MKLMALLSTLGKIFIASLAALPTSMFYIVYEGSIFRTTGWFGSIFWVIVFAMIGCIVIGMPTHFVLQRKNIDSRLAYGLVGFIAIPAILVFSAIITMEWGELVKLNNYEHGSVFAVAGAFVALAWREMIER